MVNRKLLLGTAMRKGISCKDISTALNINPSTLSMKLGNKREFTIAEVGKLKELLNLSNKDFNDIFFA